MLMKSRRTRAQALRTVTVALCCGGLLGALPVAAATAAKAKPTSTSTFDGTARKN
jgi:hypothetical protein